MAFQDMLDFLEFSWSHKNKIAPCLVGPVGIGKTEAVIQHAKNHDANVVKIVASQILPTEVSGLTMPNHDTHSMDIYDHFRLSNMKDGDILFFDELLEADQSVLKACLTLIESREMMSGTPLPDIQIVAATNPTIMPAALAENIRQRFLFKEFALDRLDTVNYIEKRFGVLVDKWLYDALEVSNSSYNILTPREATKLFEWAFTFENDKEKLNDWADMIDTIFDYYKVGSRIADAIAVKSLHSYTGAEIQIRKKLRDEVANLEIAKDDYQDIDFYSDDLQNIIAKLQKLNIWSLISTYLSNIELEIEPEKDKEPEEKKGFESDKN